MGDVGRVRVEYAGCAAVVEGPICEWGNVRLTLWVEQADDSSSAAPQVAVDGRSVAAEWRAEGSGMSTEVDVRGGRSLRVRARHGNWILALRRHRPSQVIQRAFAERGRDRQRAYEILDELGPELDGRQKIEEEALRARLARSAGRREEAVRRFRRAAHLASIAGVRSRVVTESLGAAYTLIRHGEDLGAAERAIDEAANASGGAYPEGLAHVDYFRALTSRAAGDLRGAVRSLVSSRNRARRLQMGRAEWGASQVLATTLASMGRTAEALEVLEDMRDHPVTKASPCNRADVLTNLGWVRALAAESGRQAPAASAVLSEAKRLFETRCDRPSSASNVSVNLAFAHLLEGNNKSAEGLLEAVRPHVMKEGTHVLRWWVELMGRMALARGRPQDALTHYEQLRVLGESAADPHASWRAFLGKGLGYRAMGRISEARASLFEAERILDRGALTLGLSQGRGVFVASRSRSAQELVSLLLDTGESELAVRVARHARRRLFAQLDRDRMIRRMPPPSRAKWDAALGEIKRARDTLELAARNDWKLSGAERKSALARRTELRSRLQTALDDALDIAPRPNSSPFTDPPVGVVMIGFHPIRDASCNEPCDSGWLSYAIREGRPPRVAVHRGCRPSKTATDCKVDIHTVARTTLREFGGLLRGASALWVAAYGPLQAIDFHALTDGTLPVAYTLDLGHTPEGVAAPAKAIVVSDPTGDLPHSRAEGDDVRQAFAERGLRVRTLDGPRARKGAFIAELESADVLHYAGHGEFDGTKGAESALLMNGGSRLLLSEILALSRVPPSVYLSGCETGRTALLDGAHLGLAQAFVVAGAKQVIATTRPVEDGLASRVAVLVHRSGTHNLPRALHMAQKRLAQETPGADWAAFRVVTR